MNFFLLLILTYKLDTYIFLAVTKLNQLTLKESFKAGQVGGTYNLSPGLVTHPFRGGVRVGILQGHASCQQESPDVIINTPSVGGAESEIL